MKKAVRLFGFVAIMASSLFIFAAFPSLAHSASTLGDSTHISYGGDIEGSIDSLGSIDKYQFDGDDDDKVINLDAIRM